MKHKHWNPGTLMAQAYRDIANEHNATVDALEAALAPIRVPFSDEVIERMAEAACDGFGITSQGVWGVSNHNQKEAWKQSIRAALAAGGIEPCAAPQYAPERRSAARLSELFYKMTNNSDNDATAPWTDSKYVAAMTTIRKAVEAPLLAEIAESDSALRRVNGDYERTRAQLEAVTAERDKNFVEWRAAQSTFEETHRAYLEANQRANKAQSDLAAMRQPVDATPTDAQVEALARVLEAASAEVFDESHAACIRRQARAAYAHIGRVPVGVELDVTADELRRKRRELGRRDGTLFEQDNIDLLGWLRSRIKPVYECKECAKRASELDDSGIQAMGRLNRKLRDRIDAARIALEGE